MILSPCAKEQKINLIKEMIYRAEKMYCHICGYYCIGNGGKDCINKSDQIKLLRNKLINKE